ncbi:MAG TPA: M15 family metallopeptidase [Marmoricola sp.]
MVRASSLVVVLTALVGGLLVASPASAATDPTPTTLALSGPASARITSKATLQAALTETPADSDARPLAGRPVAFQHWDGQGWATVATASTDTDGTAHVAVPITAAGNRFRAEYAGDQQDAPATSEPVTVTGTKYPTRLVLGGDARVVDEHTAHLTLRWRTPSGKPVPGVVRVYQHVRKGSWHLLRRVALGADGAARLAVRPRVDTWYQLRGGAGRWWEADTSGTHRLDNVPPMHPIVLPAAAPRPKPLPPQPRAVGAGSHITVSRIPDRVWHQMRGVSWHRGCPVGRPDLRLMQINYWGFDGYRHRGELVVNRHAVGKFRGAFHDLYAGRFPIRAMYLVDRFGYSSRSGGGNDFAAMRHDDTNAFNCRWVTGRPGVRSPHSYGYALDLNTWENPYSSRVGLLPDSWWMAHSNPRYAWRSRQHAVVRLMARHGLRWTYGLGDTQHFDA